MRNAERIIHVPSEPVATLYLDMVAKEKGVKVWRRFEDRRIVRMTINGRHFFTSPLIPIKGGCKSTMINNTE